MEERLKTDDQNISEGDFGLGKNITAESFDNLEKDLRLLKKDFENEKTKVISMQTDIEKSKFDLITLIGVFVGLITYLGLEIQVFKTISNPLMIIGISIFFIASILLFILCINTVVKKTEAILWNDFKTPLYSILLILLVISIGFIILGYNDFKTQNGFIFNTYEF